MKCVVKEKYIQIKRAGSGESRYFRKGVVR